MVWWERDWSKPNRRACLLRTWARRSLPSRWKRWCRASRRMAFRDTRWRRSCCVAAGSKIGGSERPSRSAWPPARFVRPMMSAFPHGRSRRRRLPSSRISPSRDTWATCPPPPGRDTRSLWERSFPGRAMRGWSRERLMERHPYTAAVLGLLARIEETQGPAIAHAVETIFRSLKGGGILHVFGSGHSVSVAQEAFHRAGGLVPVNLIHEVMLSPLTPPDISGRMALARRGLDSDLQRRDQRGPGRDGH